MYIADLHIHSRYSMATSKFLTPEYLDLWARKKGIHILGTGDFTHPLWRQELKEKLEPAEPGLYKLKPELRLSEIPSGSFDPRFVVSGEISTIYKKNGRTRKVHSLILLPGLEAADRLSGELEKIGNIHSDGRPILGLDCHDLLDMTLSVCPDAMYIPAHIWTPHFSVFGAFSGFNSMEECFEELTPHIHAVETGKLLDLHMLQGILRRVVDTHFLLVLRADGLVRSATRNSLGARIDQYNAQPAFGRRNGAARARHACADHDDVCIERFSNIGVGDRLRRDFEAPFLGSRLRSQRSVRRCATVRPFAFRRRRRASGQRPHRPQRADRTRALQKVTTIQFHDSLLDPIETTA